MLDELLEKKGLGWSDLSKDEKATLSSWETALQQGQLTVEKIRGFIQAMRDSVETELCKIGHESKQDIYLKARLKNLMMIESLLTTPEKAKKQMEAAIAGIANGIG